MISLRRNRLFNDPLDENNTSYAEQLLRSTLNALFRANLLFLYFIYCCCYYTIILFFVILITIAGKSNPSCIRCGDDSFGDISPYGADATFSCVFILSWTTITTVGYGTSYASTIKDNQVDGRCYGINFILMVESFTGVLFVGLCGAILFGRAMRIQSVAPVSFSNPIVIRFGSGLNAYDVGKDDRMGSGSGSQHGNRGRPRSDSLITRTLPCPIMEFRILNHGGDEKGNEIIDASITCVSLQLDTTDAMTRETAHILDNRLIKPSDEENISRALTTRPRKLSKQLSFRANDEGSYFQFLHESVELVNSEHPYFQRVWTVQHVLNESSPLLAPEMKDEIERNGGRWPMEHNNYHSIRASLKFDQLIVSMNGVSNLSGTSVYAEKVYDYVDVVVGYEFVQVLSKKLDGCVVTEPENLHDVNEQKGDDVGEPLICLNDEVKGLLV